jgi:hypothetical protein
VVHIVFPAERTVVQTPTALAPVVPDAAPIRAARA